MSRIYASSGGGIRIGATFGALLEGERQGKFSPSGFDYYIGTSAGGLDAALTANGWTAEQKCRLFINTDFSQFFTLPFVPFKLRKNIALFLPMSLRGLERFYESLCKANPYGPPLSFVPNLYINTVDTEENIQIVYCNKLPDWAVVEIDPNDGRLYSTYVSKQGEKKKLVRWEMGNIKLSRALARSATLPGLIADNPRYMDGGISENPVLTVIPRDESIFLMHLGYAGLVSKSLTGSTVPKGLLDRFLYSYEFKAYTFTENLIKEFNNLSIIYPEIYNVDSTAFDMSRRAKEKLIEQSGANTKQQWQRLP